MQNNDENYEDEDDRNGQAFWSTVDGRMVILIEGNISVTQEQLDTLDYSIMLAVDGHLHVDGCPSHILYVSGDIYCNTISLNNEWLRNPVGGTVYARDCAWLWAEDHETLCTAPVVKLETRFLFSWFYDIDNLALSADTVIFILADGDYCSGLALPNPVFTWHDAVFVLREQFVLQVDSEDSDAPAWRSDAIEAALQNGEDIFLGGFDIACVPHVRAAKEAMAARDYRSAYLLSRKVARVAPAYYKGWFGMGSALLQAGAYEQALRPFQEAANRFPVNQTGLINTAANHGALCAIRCRNVTLAIRLATVSIDHIQEGMYNRNLMASAYRFRAEAYLLSGRETKAAADLYKAISYNPRHRTANWLMGLVHHRNGAEQQARKFHRIAADQDPDFAVYYDVAGNTDFLSPKALHIDWDT